MLLTSFAPVLGEKPEVLILGSMPGSLSLQKQQYYAHPRNAFWTIMGEICDAAPELEYEKRLEKLKIARIALWDVLQHCERKQGSLDSAINSESEVPNRINEILDSYKTIKKVCFNGGKAFQSFNRHFKGFQTDRELIQLTSTSPANARLSLSEKAQIWKAAFKH